MTDLPTPNTTQPYILQQYDRSSNTEHNTTVYITIIWPIFGTPNTYTTVYIVTIWPILEHRTQHNRIYIQQYDRSSNTEHGQPYIYTTMWPIFQHRSHCNRIYYNNMTDLVHRWNTTVYIVTIWPIFQHLYILQQYDRSSNTCCNTYRIYCVMTDLGTPNTT